MKKKDVDIGYTLTRADLADAITEEFRITKMNAAEVVDVVLEEIKEALVSNEDVKISGFGTFSVRQKGERIGRNPKTLEEAVISSRKSVTFRASPILKDIVNDK